MTADPVPALIGARGPVYPPCAMGELAGQGACLGAAALWALAVVAFRAPIARHGAAAINLFKSLLALG